MLNNFRLPSVLQEFFAVFYQNIPDFYRTFNKFWRYTFPYKNKKYKITPKTFLTKSKNYAYGKTRAR